MTGLVVDASLATAYVIGAQRTSAAAAVFADWPRYRASAPYVFLLEMPWVLLKLERRSRERGLARAGLRRLDQLGIEVAPPPEPGELNDAFTLASERGIGFYDAMYVMLAAQTGAALCTRDAAQAAVARALGVEVLDVR